MKIEPTWDHFRSFLAVIETASLSGAARSLGTTQPTIGRHIDALEAALGLPLFVRSRHGLNPTTSALALVPHAKDMASASAALIRKASGEGEEARGIVRLTVSEIIGTEVLPPIIRQLREIHPAIDLELVLTNSTENLLRREADIAIRMMRPAQEALVARKIGDVPIRLYAHETYIKNRGIPEALDDLPDHTLIGPDSNISILEAVERAGLKNARANIRLASDSDLTQLALLRAGCGIGGMQMQLAAREPKIVPVLHDAFEIPMEMWLVMHEGLRTSQRVRLTFDHLVEHLNAFVHFSDERLTATN